MRAVIELSATIAVGAAAILMVAFRLDERRPSGSEWNFGSVIENWAAESSHGNWIGPQTAEMVVTEFVDFTCPFCRDLVPVLDSLRHRYTDQVALVILHFPLDREHSIPAAIVAECAGRQGRFGAMYRSLFAQMESFGTRHWKDFAADGEIPDTAEFNQCIGLPVDSFPAVSRGREVGERNGVVGTPAVWVNGRPYSGRNLAAFIAAAEDLGLVAR